MDTKQILERPALYESFERELLNKKAIYISGHTGWGKTTAVLDWLEKTHKSYVYFSAKQEDFFKKINQIADKLIVIDDLHWITQPEEEQLIVSLMTMNADSRFVLVGRSVLPAYLKPFQLTGQLECYNQEFLCFDRSMISDLLALYQLTDAFLPAQIEMATKGYTMGVSLLVNRLAKGEPMSTQTIERTRIDIFDCYDKMLFQHWDSNLQKFLLHMASFDKFTEDMASMVTGKKNVMEIITLALSGGSYLTFIPPHTYSVHPLFHQYLTRKQRLVCSKDFIYATYHNAALYYELEDDIENALKYYQLSDNTEKISELLILNSQRHPGNGHYYETETYYRALPKDTILASPELMSGMCMLCSLCCQPEESEYWFSELEHYGEQLEKQDKNYKFVQGKLCYLKISLPHRGSKHITALLLNVAKTYESGAFRLQEFSVTSNLPSVLNGGKDFCAWVRHDRQIYRLMKKPCELLLGRYGVGIADVALAESLFEKCSSDNLTEVMMLANAGQNAAAFKGTLEMEFAAIGILTRMMLMQNNLPSAYALLDNMRNRAQKEKMKGLVDNIEAVRTKFLLMEGKNDMALLWMREKAPDENEHFHIMKRCRYLTKVRCYLTTGKYINALQLLGRLLDYFKNYDRTYGQLEAGILLAITQYRLGQDGWQKMLDDTLVRCEYYGFIRFAAEEGAALLPLLQKVTLSTSEKYAELILKETRHYALLYPNYQKPKQVLTEPLTDTEKAVLRLLCKGLSNDEIAELMGVTLRTVKFHTGNLYAKMKVKSRTQAIQNAADLL